MEKISVDMFKRGLTYSEIGSLCGLTRPQVIYFAFKHGVNTKKMQIEAKKPTYIHGSFYNNPFNLGKENA